MTLEMVFTILNKSQLLWRDIKEDEKVRQGRVRNPWELGHAVGCVN